MAVSSNRAPPPLSQPPQTKVHRGRGGCSFIQLQGTTTSVVTAQSAKFLLLKKCMGEAKWKTVQFAHPHCWSQGECFELS